MRACGRALGAVWVRIGGLIFGLGGGVFMCVCVFVFVMMGWWIMLGEGEELGSWTVVVWWFTGL